MVPANAGGNITGNCTSTNANDRTDHGTSGNLWIGRMTFGGVIATPVSKGMAWRRLQTEVQVSFHDRPGGQARRSILRVTKGSLAPG